VDQDEEHEEQEENDVFKNPPTKTLKGCLKIFHRAKKTWGLL
jgi:hypothetical protein